MGGKPIKLHNESGFSRADLVAVVGIVSLLACWFLCSRNGEQGRIARCANNLEQMGKAMQSEAGDHDNGLPAAGIRVGKHTITWDQDLFTYLSTTLKNSTDAEASAESLLAVSSRLLCPSDTIARGRHPRSYAMGGRAAFYKWPPSPEDKAGVGVLWNDETVNNLLGDNMVENAAKNPEILPRLKLSVLGDPAGTLLITELLTPANKVRGFASIRVESVDIQRTAGHQNLTNFHFGKFNYLMADGHVELLTGLQTGGVGWEPAGIWTIKAGD
jgi:prepilin-type processing-associated H-X9-DG protein